MTQRRHPVERARPALRGGQHQGDAFKIEGRLSQAPAPRIQATKDAKSPMLELAKAPSHTRGATAALGPTPFRAGNESPI